MVVILILAREELLVSGVVHLNILFLIVAGLPISLREHLLTYALLVRGMNGCHSLWPQYVFYLPLRPRQRIINTGGLAF